MTEKGVSAEGGQLKKGNMREAHRIFWRRIFLSPFFVPALVFFGFFALNLDIVGPAYLTDEIGYLSKASTIAGQPVHFVSSWYGGYSLLIAPAFLITSNPSGVWLFILLLNAAMWASSAALLRYILKRLYRSVSPMKIQLVTLGAMAYPSWVAVSGYALATSGFVLVFMAAVAALLKSEFRRPWWLALAGILAGYLCWIHPIGYVFLVALFVIMLVRFSVVRQWRVVIPILIAAVVALGYVAIISPLLGHFMSGSASNDAHYSSQVFTMLHDMAKPSFWLRFAALTTSLTFFTVVATFGIAFYAAWPFIQNVMKRGGLQRLAILPNALVVGLVLLSTAGTILFIALTTSEVTDMRPDQWIYGRYTDMFLLPVIALGLIQSWKAKWGIWLAALTLIAGFWLEWIITPANTGYTYINKLNLQGFWPLHLTSLVHMNYFWLWGVIGAAGIAAVAFFGTNRRKGWLFLLLVICGASLVANNTFHRGRVEDYALPSTSLYAAVTQLPPGTCVGFDNGDDPNERFALYTYYFHQYDFRRLSFETWQKECPEHSMYLTFGVPPAGYTAVATDSHYQLAAIQSSR